MGYKNHVTDSLLWLEGSSIDALLEIIKAEYLKLPLTGEIKSVYISREFGFGEDSYPVIEVITYVKSNEQSNTQNMSSL